jgi:hypothetical protein
VDIQKVIKPDFKTRKRSTIPLVECREAHASSSVRRLRNQQLLMPVYQFEMDAIEIDLDALIVLH